MTETPIQESKFLLVVLRPLGTLGESVKANSISSSIILHIAPHFPLLTNYVFINGEPEAASWISIFIERVYWVRLLGTNAFGAGVAKRVKGGA